MNEYERPEGFQHEQKDCSVRALSLASNLSYEKVHEAFKIAGRKDGHKIRCKDILKKVCKILNIKANETCRSGTVRKLIKKHPTGNIFCLMRGHAFAIIDGVSHDVNSDGCHIKHAWIITKN